MANLGLIDLISLQGNDALTGLVEDVVTYAPEFSQIPVTIKDGTSYTIVKRTALPSAAFRPVNQGNTASSSTFKKEVKEMFFLDCPLTVDEAVVQGDDESAGDVLTLEARGMLQSAIIYIGAQTWYGLSNDTYGFHGIRDQVAAGVAAGGSTNTSSAYLLWLDKQGVNYPVGKKGTVALNPWMRQQVVSGSGVNFSYVTNLSAWIGLTVGSNYSTFAITGLTPGNITTQSLTDKLGAQLMASVPLYRRDGLCWFVNRQVKYQLQQSRMTINPGSGGNFSYYPVAPEGPNGIAGIMPPTDILAGYPIVETDSITNTESN